MLDYEKLDVYRTALEFVQQCSPNYAFNKCDSSFGNVHVHVYEHVHVLITPRYYPLENPMNQRPDSYLNYAHFLLTSAIRPKQNVERNKCGRRTN